MARLREFDTEKVIADAMESFWVQGYGATSMKDLSSATGVLSGSLHAAFGGKKQLFLAALDCYTQQGLNAISERLSQDGSVLDAIRQCLMPVATEHALEKRQKGCLIANSIAELIPHDAEVTVKVQFMFRRMEDLFAGAIARAQSEGEISRNHDPYTLARFIVSAIQGLRIYGKPQPADRSLADIIDVIIAACR
jgi:TetR/AcrR family transcriptional regulator, transcriptional repressor for nem operon